MQMRQYIFAYFPHFTFTPNTFHVDIFLSIYNCMLWEVNLTDCECHVKLTLSFVHRHWWFPSTEPTVCVAVYVSFCPTAPHLLLLLCVLLQPVPVSLGLLHHLFMGNTWGVGVFRVRESELEPESWIIDEFSEASNRVILKTDTPQEYTGKDFKCL